jgi:hypothetical protein
MEGSNLANIEALCNICANAAEILAISSGGWLLFLWWVPHACGLYGYRLKIFLLGAGMIILGLATPAIVGALMGGKTETGVVLGLIAGIILLLVSIALSLIGFFLPTYFAVRVRKKRRKVWIIVLNVLGIIPMLWLVPYVWSCMEDKEPQGR